ncbi:MAG: hypothetical protein EXS40_04600 [Opitutaceae bacterium]|nr:hypothetical protein [Opitutaceae bacterium]
MKKQSVAPTRPVVAFRKIPWALLHPTACVSLSLVAAGFLFFSSSARAADEKTSALSGALTFHASFDQNLAADFSRGDKTCFVRKSTGVVPAVPTAEINIAPEAGRFGGALHFTKKGSLRPQFKGADIFDYNDRNWSATVSVWLRLDPEKDLEPGYCDPVQIIGADSKKGFIFLEWSKDEAPRFFRFAIRPLFPIWNPTNVPWADIPFEKRPMVQVARAPFSREAWTHVVFSFDHINDKRTPPVGTLYLNGRSQGRIENWDLTFGWERAQVQLVLGSAYVGYLDDLAVFNRALIDSEVTQLFGLKTGIRELRQ